MTCLEATLYCDFALQRKASIFRENLSKIVWGGLKDSPLKVLQMLIVRCPELNLCMGVLTPNPLKSTTFSDNLTSAESESRNPTGRRGGTGSCNTMNSRTPGRFSM
jgi:hypothetical protein